MKASSNRLTAREVARSPRYVYPSTIQTENGDRVRTVTIANNRNGSEELPPLHAVVGNGAWGGPNTMGRTMRVFLAAAYAARQRAAVTMYAELSGRRGCAQADRAATLNAVLAHAADRAQRPVQLVAHSWSGAPMVRGALAHADMHVGSFVGHTFASRMLPGKLKIGGALMAGLREMIDHDGLDGPGSFVSIAATLGSAVAHSITCLPTAYREASAAFNTDHTPALVALSRRLPSGLTVAEKDNLYGPGEFVKEKLETAGFIGPIAVLAGATHSSSVSNRFHGQALFELASQVHQRATAA